MKRGELWWASLPDPAGSEAGFRRPVLVLQDNSFNDSKIATVIVAVIISNLRLADAPGNVRLAKRETRLTREGVVNVSQILTVNKDRLTERISAIPAGKLQNVERGLKLVLGLSF
jgi:mRNA interferase MazF